MGVRYKRHLVGLVWGRACFYCAYEGPKISVDHVVPRSAGGSNSLGNKVIACIRCNNVKGDMSMEQFIEKYPHYIRTDFNPFYAYRRELDEKGIRLECPICDGTYFHDSFSKRYCGMECRRRAEKIRREVLRDTPVYARMVFDSGKDFPKEIYKEYL